MAELKWYEPAGNSTFPAAGVTLTYTGAHYFAVSGGGDPISSPVVIKFAANPFGKWTTVPYNSTPPTGYTTSVTASVTGVVGNVNNYMGGFGAYRWMILLIFKSASGAARTRLVYASTVSATWSTYDYPANYSWTHLAYGALSNSGYALAGYYDDGVSNRTATIAFSTPGPNNFPTTLNYILSGSSIGLDDASAGGGSRPGWRITNIAQNGSWISAADGGVPVMPTTWHVMAVQQNGSSLRLLRSTTPYTSGTWAQDTNLPTTGVSGNSKMVPLGNRIFITGTSNYIYYRAASSTNGYWATTPAVFGSGGVATSIGLDPNPPRWVIGGYTSSNQARVAFSKSVSGPYTESNPGISGSVSGRIIGVGAQSGTVVGLSDRIVAANYEGSIPQGDYGLRDHVEWVWTDFPNADRPIHIDWLPGLFLETNVWKNNLKYAGDEGLSGSWEYDFGAIPKKGSEAEKDWWVSWEPWWTSVWNSTTQETTYSDRVYPPEQAIEWTHVLAAIHEHKFHAWMGIGQADRYDLFHPDLIVRPGTRAYYNYSFNWSATHVQLQQAACLSLVTGCYRTAPNSYVQNGRLAKPPYIPLYSMKTGGEGPLMAHDMKRTSYTSGSTLIAFILRGGFSTLHSHVQSFISAVVNSMPGSDLLFVSTGEWSGTTATRLYDFDGGYVSVGGDGLWMNDKAFPEWDGYGAERLVLQELWSVNARDFSMTSLADRYTANPVYILPDGSPIYLTDDDHGRPALGDVYRHIIGWTVNQGSPWSSKHIVDLSGYHPDTSYGQGGRFVYSSFGPRSADPYGTAGEPILEGYFR